MPRSSSEYATAIGELSDLIIERRLKILHHWDWIYWRTQQGKRFKKALNIVHKYRFLLNVLTNFSCTGRQLYDDHRFTRDVVQKRRALIGQRGAAELAEERKRDFVDIILLSKVEKEK